MSSCLSTRSSTFSVFLLTHTITIYNYKVTLFSKLFSEESCSVVGLSEQNAVCHCPVADQSYPLFGLSLTE